MAERDRQVRVAVIDTGVDVKNPQLTKAVDVGAGANYLPKKDDDGKPIEGRGNERGTTDVVGHGTRVAGIIAARKASGTGFVGLAPDATIIPIKQNDAEGHGDSDALALAIDHAIAEKADVINISQDTEKALAPGSKLETAVNAALGRASWSSPRPATTASAATSRTPTPPRTTACSRSPPPTATTNAPRSPSRATPSAWPHRAST